MKAWQCRVLSSCWLITCLLMCRLLLPLEQLLPRSLIHFSLPPVRMRTQLAGRGQQGICCCTSPWLSVAQSVLDNVSRPDGRSVTVPRLCGCHSFQPDQALSKTHDARALQCHSDYIEAMQRFGQCADWFHCNQKALRRSWVILQKNAPAPGFFIPWSVQELKSTLETLFAQIRAIHDRSLLYCYLMFQAHRVHSTALKLV